MIGLVESANRYDENIGVNFGEFARHRIRGAMLDAIKKRRIVTDHNFDINQIPDEDYSIDRECDLINIYRIANRLPSRLREIAIMSYVYGISMSKIGLFLGLTEARVCQLRHLSVEEIKQKLCI